MKIATLVLSFMFLSIGFSFAQQSLAQSSASSSQLVDAGNKYCPVSGRQIGLMGPGVQVTYNGKIYHLCCGGCISTFNSDPQKYAQIADNQAK